MDQLSHIYAKSPQRGRPAEPLSSHLLATLKAGEELRTRVGRVDLAERALSGRFWAAVLLAALTHDAGKVAEGFQQMVTGRARNWGERHEVVSLGFLPHLLDDPALLEWVASAVVTHHRPLTHCERLNSIRSQYGVSSLDELRAMIGPIDVEVVQALAAWLHETARGAGLPVTATATAPQDLVASAHDLLQRLLDRWEHPDRSPGGGLAAVLLQGAVTLADHLSSARGTLHPVQPIGAGFETLLATKMSPFHKHQISAAEAPHHLLLRAPTGSGKTEAGLLWAARQVEAVATATGGTPRVFFTLPYLASINAMAERISELLGDKTLVGVAHSRAASYYLATAISSEDDSDRRQAASKAVARAAATRLFRETVRIATPYQLLRGMLAGPAHSSILIDSANSVFVLDELHAYDARRLGYILAMARFWEQLGGRIAVLSATLPQALAHLINDSLAEPVEPVDAMHTDAAGRHRLRLRHRHLTDPASLEEIRDRLLAGIAVLVVANNVGDAQLLMDSLAPDAEQRYGSGAAILLHSRFRRKDRSAIERAIAKRYGSTRKHRQPGLVVATQVVEVSLDVDFDVLFTSAAPLEALLQRFGRVNRRGERAAADVIVHEPAYRPRRTDPSEYADGVYPREPTEAGWDILCRHQDEVVNEAHATGWLDEVYKTPWGQQWRSKVEHHRRAFQEDFLKFEHPYASREHLSDRFDELFEGTEAVLLEDLDDYTTALTSADAGERVTATGRLLAEELLIPIPYWRVHKAWYDKRLQVRVIDGEYDPARGLISVRGVEERASYQAGEVL